MSKFKTIIGRLASLKNRRKLNFKSALGKKDDSISGFAHHLFLINSNIVVFSIELKCSLIPDEILMGHGESFESAIFYDVVFNVDTQQKCIIPDSAIRLNEKLAGDIFIKVIYAKTHYVARCSDIRSRNPSQLSIQKQYKIQEAILAPMEIPPLNLAEEGRPLISVILPLFKPNFNQLQDCLNSIKNQRGNPRCELIVAVDGEHHIDKRSEYLLHDFFKEFEGQCIINPDHQHISLNLNAGLTRASGSYCAFVDQDDMLHQDALWHISKAILDQQPDVIYTDENKINAAGEAVTPIYKPDFSPYYLISTNYINHLLVVSKKAGEHIGWFRSGVEGAQDHDLLLRLSVHTKFFHHVPKILYHWRISEGSTASDFGNKSYAKKAGMFAIEHYFKLKGWNNRVVEGKFAGCYSWEPKENLEKRVIIFRYSGASIKNLVRDINVIRNKTEYTHWSLVQLTPHAQSPGLKSQFELVDNIRFAYSDQKGFDGALINQLARQEQTDIFGFMDEDCLPQSGDWMKHMVDMLSHSALAVAGCKIIDEQDRLLHAGQVVGMANNLTGNFMEGMNDDHPGYFRKDVVREVSSLSFNGLFISRTAWAQIQGVDDRLQCYRGLYICMKIRELGGVSYCNPRSVLVKRARHTNQKFVSEADKDLQLILKHWPELLGWTDPYYNPNLSKTSSSVMLSVFDP